MQMRLMTLSESPTIFQTFVEVGFYFQQWEDASLAVYIPHQPLEASGLSQKVGHSAPHNDLARDQEWKIQETCSSKCLLFLYFKNWFY